MKKQQQADLTKDTLAGVFLSVFGIFAGRFGRRHRRQLHLPPTDLILLSLSTFRLGRLVAFDKIFGPIRAPVAVTQPDETGAGDTTAPRGSGVRRSFGELITCPICAGTWIAAGLVYALHLWPGATRLFLTLTGAIGAAELLNALTEWLSWTSQAARKEAGEK